MAGHIRWLLLLIFSTALFSQEELAFQEPEGETIIFSERIGEEMDVHERDMFHLYPGIERFVSAKALKLNDGSCIFRIVSVDDSTGAEVITRHPVLEASLKKLGEYIDRMVIPEGGEASDTLSSVSASPEEAAGVKEEMSAPFIPSPLDEGEPQFSVQGGIAIPTGDASDVYNTGFHFGINVRFPIKDSRIRMVTGAYFTIVTGKEVTEVEYESGQGWSRTIWYTYIYEDAKPLTIFCGPKVGSSRYFLPALTASFREDYKRIGFDLSAGIVVQGVVNENNLDLCVKYSLLNMIGKEDGEMTFSGFRILAGLMF